MYGAGALRETLAIRLLNQLGSTNLTDHSSVMIPAERAGSGGQGHQVTLLLTTGTTARRVVSRHLQQV
jgi:hypothetical protein